MILFDLIILCLIGLFGFAGAKRGFVWEIFSTIGIILGLWIPYIYRFQIVDFIARHIGPGRLRFIITVAALLFIFAAIYVILSYIGYFLGKLLKKVFLGWLDRLLGVFAGLVKGFLIIGIVVAALLASPWHRQGEILVRKSKLLTWGKGQVERVIDEKFISSGKRV